jgi:hypothetical protein
VNTVAWVLSAVTAVIAVTTAIPLRLQYRLARRYREMRPGFAVWAVQVALTASVPVVIIATGRIGWYPPTAGVAVLAVGAGYAWVRRSVIAGMLRAGRRPRG